MTILARESVKTTYNTHAWQHPQCIFFDFTEHINLEHVPENFKRLAANDSKVNGGVIAPISRLMTDYGFDRLQISDHSWSSIVDDDYGWHLFAFLDNNGKNGSGLFPTNGGKIYGYVFGDPTSAYLSVYNLCQLLGSATWPASRLQEYLIGNLVSDNLWYGSHYLARIDDYHWEHIYYYPITRSYTLGQPANWWQTLTRTTWRRLNDL